MIIYLSDNNEMELCIVLQYGKSSKSSAMQGINNNVVFIQDNNSKNKYDVLLLLFEERRLGKSVAL
jgi:hypothetical protein